MSEIVETLMQYIKEGFIEDSKLEEWQWKSVGADSEDMNR